MNKFIIASRVFSRSAMLDLLSYSNGNNLFKPIILNSGINTNNCENLENILENIYSGMLKHYRNEYILKNKLAHNIVKSRHKFKNISFVNELRIGNNICDVAIFNGTSTAYEIKTELDNFDKLNRQLNSYKTVFEKVYVVVDEKIVHRIPDNIPETTGILIFTENGRIQEVRPAFSNFDFFQLKNLFYTLRPKDAENLCITDLDFLAKGSVKRRREECLELFTSLPIETAHKLFIKHMKNRSLSEFERLFLFQSPKSILALLLNLRLRKNQLENLFEKLKHPL